MDKPKKKKRLTDTEVSGKSKKRKSEEEPKKKKRKSEPEDAPKKKKRKVDEDEVPKKKKKKKASTALTLLDISSSAISRLDEEGRESILGSSASKIQELLESGHNESASSLLTKRLLQTLVDLIPHAENNVRATKGQRGVYQINSLITSVREILSDLQANKDRGALGASLIARVLQPSFTEIAQIIVQEEVRVAGALKDIMDHDTYLKSREIQKESITRIAHVIQRKYESAKEETIAFLQS